MYTWFTNWIAYNGGTTLQGAQQYIVMACCIIGCVVVIEIVELAISAAKLFFRR